MRLAKIYEKKDEVYGSPGADRIATLYPEVRYSREPFVGVPNNPVVNSANYPGPTLQYDYVKYGDKKITDHDSATRNLGLKQYELKDNLGNVRATFLDAKIPAGGVGSTPSTSFTLKTMSVDNYYPYGSSQEGLCYTFAPDVFTNPYPIIHGFMDSPPGGVYPFGFDGMKREGKDFNSRRDAYNTAFREYDADLGRWWSLDPKPTASESWYAGMGNNPVNKVDPDGQRGVAAVNESEKTITIMASYYIPLAVENEDKAYTTEEIEKLNTMQDELNAKHFKVEEGQYKGYNVVFNLQFESQDQPDGEVGTPEDDTFFGVKFGNYFQRKNEDYVDITNITDPKTGKITKTQITKFKPRADGGAVGGLTKGDDRSVVIINTVYDYDTFNIRIRLHEIWHSLFYDNDKDPKEGVGSYDMKLWKRIPYEDSIKQHDIDGMINNPKLPKVLIKVSSIIENE